MSKTVKQLIDEGRLKISIQSGAELGYKKCERCRNWGPDVDYNKYFGDNLCYRCVQVLCELEEKGNWLKCPACLEWFFEEVGDPSNVNDNYLCPDCLKEMEA